MTAKKPILVTGSHRSGSTWVGKMIAASPQVYYVHEPFNVNYPPRPGICAAKMPCWFSYITRENESLVYQPLKRTLALRYDIGAELAAIKSLRDVARLCRDYPRMAWYQQRHAVPLLKDPIALFSTEWLANAFDMHVIVMIRHPAAFASSLRRLGWPQQHHFASFLQQPLLMRDHLSPFEEEITDFAQHDHDLLDQAILLWRIFHYMILKLKASHQDWIFLRHEDISIDPFPHFEYLFKRCDLDFSEHVKSVILDYTNPSNPAEAREKELYGKRDSKAHIKSWQKKLTETEVAHVRKSVEDISKEFYVDSDW